jgi:hypothetical protein
MGCGTILMLHMRETHASAQNSGTIWMVLKRRTLITWTLISGCLQTLIALLYGWRCTSPVAYVISLQIKSFLYVAWNTDTVIYCQNALDLMSQVFGDQWSLVSGLYIISHNLRLAFCKQDSEFLLAALSNKPVFLRNEATDNNLVVDYKDWQIPLGRRFRSVL